MDVVEARPCDARAVAALYGACVGLPGCTWTADYPNMEDILSDIAQRALFVAWEEEALIAAVSVGFARELDEACAWPPAQNPCELARICVSPALRGRGLAGALLSDMMRRMRARGHDVMRFLVSRENVPAMRLYARAGFASCGGARLYERDWLCMQRVL